MHNYTNFFVCASVSTTVIE